MAIEDFLILPDLDKALRINKDCQKPFYAVFQDEVKDNTFITTEIRKNIVIRWEKIVPLIPTENLRAHLWVMEQKYWAAKPKWQAPELINKITDQSMKLQEQVMQGPDSIIRKANTINDLNTTIAKVNKLDAQAPTATFIINTNVNDDEMINQMNVIDIDTEEEDDDNNPSK